MGPLTFAWLTRDITDTGVLGDATAADPDKGERYLSDAATQTAEMLRTIVDFHFAEDAAQTEGDGEAEDPLDSK
jgi:creatinine amidohydrolase/Fe(II)-dependent formamide hydrolase-like protein